jgi:hypothetical protein
MRRGALESFPPACIYVISILASRTAVWFGSRGFYGDPKDQYVDDQGSADRPRRPVSLEYTGPALAGIKPMLPYL